MKKYAITIAVALAGMAMAGTAQADPIQSLETKISQTKLDKKKPKSVGLFVDIITQRNSGASSNSDQPPNASKSVVDFPKNISVDTEGYPKCQGTAEELQNTTAEQAVEICGAKSVISDPKGSQGELTVDSNPVVADGNAFVVDISITAFNGPGKDELIFHTRADAVNNTTILEEQFEKSKAGNQYGTALITNIPPILAGAPNDFRVTIKPNTIISAVCKTKKNPFNLTSTFIDYTPSVVSDTTETTCTQKKSKKKKK